MEISSNELRMLNLYADFDVQLEINLESIQKLLYYAGL